MKNQLWAFIYDLFMEVDQLRSSAQSVVKLKKGGEMRKLSRGIQAEEIISLRAGIRAKLDHIKAQLAQTLNEREVYLVLFPTVIYFDEMAQVSISQTRPIEWPPLQKELFQIDNGGEMFYEVIDDILLKPDTLPFIYEVFYFCLSDGFQGKFGGDMVKINQYKDKLCAKIPVPSVEPPAEQEKTPNLMQFAKFPVWYYAAAVVFIIAVYAGLSLLATQ